MGLPQPPSAISPQTEELSEPLDLRTNHNCICKSPPIKRQKYYFQPNEPLDLSIRRSNIGPPFHSSCSENQESNAFIETKNYQFSISITDHQNLSASHDLNKLNSKLNQIDYFPDKFTIESSISPICLLNLSNKKFQPDVSEDNSTFVSVPCDNASSKLSVEKVETAVGEQSFQTLKIPPNETHKEVFIEKQFEHSSKTVSNIPLLHESNSSEKSPTNKIADSAILNHNIIASREIFNKTEKSNCKRNKNKTSETKIIEESPFPLMMTDGELATKENEDGFRGNCKAKVKHKMINHDHDYVPIPKMLKFECSGILRNLLTKPTIEQLKETGKSFPQDGKCFEIAPKLPRCRECSLAVQDPLHRIQLGSDNSLCRFYAFRKLRYSKKGHLATAGFLDPVADVTPEDLSLWQPKWDPPPDLDPGMAKYLLSQVGDQFCDLCRQEEEAISVHMSQDKKVAWKRLVPECREMCDVCNTTLFNFHWTCRTCGFAICMDCYKTRKGCLPGALAVERPWMICVNKRAHDQEKLMLTQIIAADSLKKLWQKDHDIRTSLGLPLHCGCQKSCQNTPVPFIPEQSPIKFSNQEISPSSEIFVKQIEEEIDFSNKMEIVGKKTAHTDSIENPTNQKTSKNNIDKNISFEDSLSDSENYMAKFFSSLRLRIKPRLNESTPRQVPSNGHSSKSVTYADKLEEVILSVFNEAADVDAAEAQDQGLDTHSPAKIMTLTESSLLYPDCQHSWLCEGRLLKLSDPIHPGNYKVFQDQWKRGQPVLVSGVLKFLNKELWQPDSFIRDFGNTTNDLVNCMTGCVIPGQYMRHFWEGFQEVSKMLKDENGKPMLLKLKDWPPGEDFAEMLPSRFEDLMNALPMGEYTKRTGQLNLPSRLPSSFARPDLGPKMYIAYGSVIHPNKGTTNLHLDISDAVNVMVYVGIPKDIDHEEFIKGAYRAVDEACCEVLMRRRVREELPGALWHIYSARDTDKIRHLLTRVAQEQKIKLGPHQDPIHDQNWYLDAELRERLYKEYDVRGYSIVQCLGDAIFIPAGAPHQVRNLLNCIKVAEDFVSPENVSHCLHLTQEFRRLSDSHTNHEDKLQIKNIIYHSVKDAVSVLSR